MYFDEPLVLIAVWLPLAKRLLRHLFKETVKNSITYHCAKLESPFDGVRKYMTKVNTNPTADM